MDGTRTRRGGGGAARRAERDVLRVEAAARITRAIPDYALLDDDALSTIEEQADALLAEIGVAFVENPCALRRWREAGAEVEGDIVRLPHGLARSLCARAPSRFAQIARDPAKSVEIGGRDLVLAPVYGPPFVRDGDTRRYATLADLERFVRLGHMCRWLHHSGGTVCEPTDAPVATRHLDMLWAHATLTDKPFMGAVTEPSRAADSVAFADILLGGLGDRTGLISLVEVNSPLTFDATTMGALEVYAAANQACIVSPFIVGGAMAPVTVGGTLVQVLAEAMAGIAYAQLVRPGAPVVFGAFVASIDMGTGAPIFGTPEAAMVTYGAGQLARRLGLPYRSGGAFCGSKLPDAQAAYETANSLQSGLLAGVNFMLHACGWLEGGLVADFDKFVMDADQLGALHRMARGAGADPEALDVLREIGPGGHFLGVAHARARDRDAFWRSDVLDYRPFETWLKGGAPDTRVLATSRTERLLAAYEAPPMDPGIRAELAAFVAERKAALATAG